MAEHTEHNINVSDRHMAISQSRGYAGLRTPETLGRHPWIGLILLLIGGIAFGALSLNVLSHGPLTAWDVPLSRELPAYSLQHAALFRPITTVGFFVGGWVLTILALLLDIYFLIKHYWEELFLLLVGMLGEAGLFLLINTLIARPRPPTQIWIPLNIPSFPSGHSEASLVFYGFLAYMLVPKVRSGFGKALIIIFSILIILFVGFTRIYTAGHYLTDVLGGYALGLSWAAIAYTFVELYFIGRRKRHGKNREAPPS